MVGGEGLGMTREVGGGGGVEAMGMEMWEDKEWEVFMWK